MVVRDVTLDVVEVLEKISMERDLIQGRAASGLLTPLESTESTNLNTLMEELNDLYFGEDRKTLEELNLNVALKKSKLYYSMAIVCGITQGVDEDLCDSLNGFAVQVDEETYTTLTEEEVMIFPSSVLGEFQMYAM